MLICNTPNGVFNVSTTCYFSCKLGAVANCGFFSFPRLQPKIPQRTPKRIGKVWHFLPSAPVCWQLFSGVHLSMKLFAWELATSWMFPFLVAPCCSQGATLQVTLRCRLSIRWSVCRTPSPQTNERFFCFSRFCRSDWSRTKILTSDLCTCGQTSRFKTS